jgi:hypothetical protein
MRRINAPFSNRRHIRFDIALRMHLNPAGLRVAFNPLGPSEDQPAHPASLAGSYKPAARDAACARAR